jgi:hypothetical protein
MESLNWRMICENVEKCGIIYETDSKEYTRSKCAIGLYLICG